MEIGAGMNFAIITKFIPATLGLLETFQLPNGFIKSPPTHFHSTPFTLPLSRPCREPPPVPCASPSRASSVRAAAAACPFCSLSLHCRLCHHCPDSQHTTARRCRALSPAAASPLPLSLGPLRPCA